MERSSNSYFNESCFLNGKTENKSRKPIRVTAVTLKYEGKSKSMLFSLPGLPSM